MSNHCPLRSNCKFHFNSTCPDICQPTYCHLLVRTTVVSQPATARASVVFNARHLSVQFFTCKLKTTMRTILYTSYRYRLQLTSMFPISVHLRCNRIQYPLLRSTLYTEYARGPMPSIQSLLLSLVTLPSTHAYAHMAHACRSPHCFYLKFWPQQNCDGATLREKRLKPGPSCL